MDSIFYHFCRFIFWSLIIALSHAACMKAAPADAPPFARQRILFLGNSITQNGTYISFFEYYLQKAYPEESFDIVGVGLGSETVSGLTENDHPFPRPCILERVDAALTKVNPDLVVVCYGMNDGIYHPPADERLSAFQKGMERLVDKIRATGADIILQTPPPFDTLPIADKTVGLEASGFSYSQPFAGYDGVLRQYSDWLQGRFSDSFPVVDLHRGINAFLAERRKAQPDFTLAPDGIHPSETGHLLMATLLLNVYDLGPSKPPVEEWKEVGQDPLFRLINIKRRITSEAWLPYVGYVRGDTVRTADLGNLQKELEALQPEIRKLLPEPGG